MKAIIIDDEAASRDALQALIKEYFPNMIQVMTVCDNPQTGIEAIRLHKPDCVFLDVEMPEMTGFQMLKHLDFPNIEFQVIFCTAFEHYAVQAFRFSAIDFLLKPIRVEELIEAVMKVKEKILYNQRETEREKYIALLNNLQAEKTSNGYSNRKIVLSTAEGTFFINSDDIVRLEADGNYTTFHILNQKPIFIARRIGDFNEKEPFYRIHKSHSVNPKHVIKIVKGDGMQLVMSDNSAVEVSRGKKEEVQLFLRDFYKD